MSALGSTVTLMGLAVSFIEVDSFLAACAQQSRDLRGRRVVAVHTDTRPGYVASASQEARSLGVRDGMELEKAERLLGNKLVVVEADLAHALEVSDSVAGILREIGLPSSRPSLDEFALDLRYARDELGQDALTPSRIVERLRNRVRAETGLVLSVGVAGGRYGAKVAAAQARPGGVRVVSDTERTEWWQRVPVSSLAGVRPLDVDVLSAAGVRTIRDARAAGQARLERLLGRIQGAWLWQLVCGNDPLELPPESADRLTMTFTTRFADDGQVTSSLIERALREMNTEITTRLLQRRSTVSLVRVYLRDVAGGDTARLQRIPATRSFGTLQAKTSAMAADLFSDNPHRPRELTLTVLAQADTTRPSLWDEARAAARRRDGTVPAGYVVTHPAFGDGVVLGAASGMVRVLFPDRDRWLRVSQVWDESDDALLQLADIPDFLF